MPVAFDQWKGNPSAEQGVENVELLSGLAYGRLRIHSEEGSSILLGPQFEVDSAGVVQTTAELDIVEHRVLAGDAEYPTGPVQASFFQTDDVTVGERFRIVLYAPGTSHGVVAVLGRIARITIDRSEPLLVGGRFG